MVAPLVDDLSALQAVMKPASNAAAKKKWVRTLITAFYPGTHGCKVKIQPSLFGAGSNIGTTVTNHPLFSLPL
jgi:hypothetical protein